jgi:myo-inositol 2-dehydrogenase / D-chiro-inositol 1-dehydrogenase
MQTVRCGLIGYGAWGQHHARAIDRCPDARLVAIAAHTQRNYEVSRRQYPNARVYRDYREMLAAEELDLCSVAVPSDRHFEVAKDVLGSGRHLLLEKPMALTVDDCAALVRLAESAGRVLAVGHELRLSSLWGKVKELVDAGAVGDVQCVSIDLWRHPYRQGLGRWRYDPARVGDWVLEEPIHFFDLARWYFCAAGEPVSVYAAVSGPNPQTPALFDNFTATVRFPGGR